MFDSMFHMKRFTSETQKIGQMGEKIAVEFLQKQAFSIIERNYTKKIGEIDIVATKNQIIHFIEVKAIVKRTNNVSRPRSANEAGETYKNNENYNPFENVTPNKLRKFSRTIEWYLSEKRVSRETKWQIDVIAVILDQENRSAKVEVLWNVIA